MEDIAQHRIASKGYKYLVNEAKVIYKTTLAHTTQIRSTTDSYRFLMEHIFDMDTLECYEQFYVLYLNRRNYIKNIMHISTGNQYGTVVDVQRLVKGAIDCLAAGVIIAHNHPSGSVDPSPQDIKMSKNIELGLKYFDITLVDSMIVATTSYYSFADNEHI